MDANQSHFWSLPLNASDSLSQLHALDGVIGVLVIIGFVLFLMRRW